MISGKENQSGHDIDPRHHVWSNVAAAGDLLEAAPKLRRPLQGTAVELLPWPEAKKVHHRRKAGRLRWALGHYNQ